jgi:putative protease
MTSPRRPLASVPPPAPELLAPAGDWDCIRAAIENGADAVYFGLQAGFNARARAANFALADLDDLMATLHRRGLKGYVTLNTLAFTDELPQL